MAKIYCPKLNSEIQIECDTTVIELKACEDTITVDIGQGLYNRLNRGFEKLKQSKQEDNEELFIDDILELFSDNQIHCGGYLSQWE